jgi:hypothetical protein
MSEMTKGFGWNNMVYQIQKSNPGYFLIMVIAWFLIWFIGCSAIENERLTSYNSTIDSNRYHNHVDSTLIPSSLFFRGSPMGHGVYPLHRAIFEQLTNIETYGLARTTFEISWVYQGFLGEFNGISDVFGAGMITTGTNLIYHNGLSVFALDIQTGLLQWELDFGPYIESRSLIELYRVSVPVIFQQKIYLTFGTHLFTIEPEDGTYEKLASWQEYFYETGVLLWEHRVFAMDIFGRLLEYDPINREFVIRFSGNGVQEFQEIALSTFRGNHDHRSLDVMEVESQSEQTNGSSGPRSSHENSQQRIHPFAGQRIDNSFGELSTFTFLVDSEEYFIAISPLKGRVVLVPKSHINDQTNSAESIKSNPLIPGEGFIFEALVSQLPVINQLDDQEILVIPFVADFGTQEYTVLIGFSLTDKKIRWETKISSFQVAPMVMAQDQVIVPTLIGIKSLSLENGEILWYQTYDGVLSASGIKNLDDNTLYVVSTTYNRLVIFDGFSGEFITSVDLDDFINPPDSFMTSEGVLGVGSNLVVRIGSRIFALE